MDIQSKIKQYIRDNKISFREFAKLSGLPNSTLQSICERGINSASFLNATKIAKVLGVSLEDFETYKGDFAISQTEREFIEKFRLVDSRGKAGVEALLNHEYFAVSGKKSDSVAVNSFAVSNQSSYIEISKRKPKLQTLKVFLQPAAAGTGNYLDDEYFEEMQFENIPHGADFGVRIAGDSMTPKIRDGDIAFVKKQDSISEGEIGIYVIDGDAFCKKLTKKEDGFYLHSLNAKYADFILPENGYVVGRVVGTQSGEV